ncbi:helix-turn-helix transcriptional regulator [Tabrizicola sp.]|uniref:helix-turn-helix transcriptional regulator n=1 Tax=Tabrizicola sp. TaxID=2005166 RepID=UPI0025F2E1EC|nr:helix-turn-helix transcriptional regulator [Tabrizicola sp.]
MREPATGVEPQLARVIAALGKPQFEEALWQMLLALARPDNMLVLGYSDGGPALELCRRAGNERVFARLQSTYMAGAFRLSPFYGLHLQRADEGLYRLRDIAPDAFQRSRFYVEYFGQTTIIDEVAFTVWLGAGLSLNLFLGRDGQSGKVFSPAEIAACRRIAPVVAELARAHWPVPKLAAPLVEDTPARLAAAAEQRLGIGLSPRQAQVAVLILKGHSTLSIGLKLGLSPQTVKVFRKQLYARCAISSQAELFALMLPLL